MKYSLSPWEILGDSCRDFPRPDYISFYILTQVTMQIFLITTPALTFLEDQYWNSLFSVLLRQLGIG